jgi:hypothetical protein
VIDVDEDCPAPLLARIPWKVKWSRRVELGRDGSMVEHVVDHCDGFYHVESHDSDATCKWCTEEDDDDCYDEDFEDEDCGDDGCAGTCGRHQNPELRATIGPRRACGCPWSPPTPAPLLELNHHHRAPR